ncbi:MAG: Fe-S cluster assembly protein SufD, partial [Bacteroidales bacterium]
MEETTKQYIDLFEQNKGLIDKYAPLILNGRRDAALTMLKGTGLPSSKEEAFAHTDVQAFFAPDYGLNLRRLEIPVNPYEVFRCDVPNLSTFLYFMVNDAFYTKEQPSVKLPEGVYAGSLKQFAELMPQIAEKYYDRQASQKADGAVALNTMFTQDGFVLYVPKNVKVDKPIQLVNVLGSEIDFLVNRRILVILEQHAEAKLLLCDHAMNPVNFLANQ